MQEEHGSDQTLSEIKVKELYCFLIDTIISVLEILKIGVERLKNEAHAGIKINKT